MNEKSQFYHVTGILHFFDTYLSEFNRFGKEAYTNFLYVQDWTAAQTILNRRSARLAQLMDDAKSYFKQIEDIKSTIDLLLEILPNHENEYFFRTFLSRITGFTFPISSQAHDSVEPGIFPIDSLKRPRELKVSYFLFQSDVFEYFDKQYLSVVPTLFFRNKRAYLLCTYHDKKICLAFIHAGKKIRLDGIIQGESGIKKIFEFTRSYFLLEEDDFRQLIVNILYFIPGKSLYQLYINLGLLFHGRELMLRHIKETMLQKNECFSFAPGTKGMVMCVFTSPSIPVVCKVIRSRIPPPKDTSVQEVASKYAFVASHDRFGRLPDTQVFYDLSFPISDFDPSLIEDLSHSCTDLVEINGNQVHFRQMYMERKVIPLDVFIQNFDEKSALYAIQDMGTAIKEIIHCNIFPGDLLLKNFGVSAEGKVIFYDFDEVTTLDHWEFNPLPNDEGHSERYVRENEVFPEEFVRFLVPSGVLRDHFLQHHADLFQYTYWEMVKQNNLSVKVQDLQPYEPLDEAKLIKTIKSLYKHQ